MTQLNLTSIQHGLRRMHYKGVNCMKFPFDYVQYQMIMWEVKPDLVIEIGTLHGGSALYFADLQALNGVDGEVHTIDIATTEEEKTIRRPNAEVGQQVIDHPKIKMFTDGWEGYDLKNIEGFKRILVIDDGSHIYKDVLGALEKFGPIVTPGSYYIVEDSNAEAVCTPDVYAELEGGPLRGIMDYLREGAPYTIDLKKCDMFGINSTYNTYGYLRRV